MSGEAAPPSRGTHAMTTPILRHVAAFTTDPAGGNRAGVWIGPALPDPEAMQRIAAEIGFSETVFATPVHGPERTVRYFSPVAEVPFCGHATIALGAVLVELEGARTYLLHTRAGPVSVTTGHGPDGPEASLTSVTPRHEPASDALVDGALAALGWSRDELDPAQSPVVAFAGARHLVLAARTRERLSRLDYDVGALAALMAEAELVTVALTWRAADGTFHVRNAFPAGAIVEDPATGAAAAALGGYLRDAGLLAVPARLDLRQGDDMGRPSRLVVDVPAQGGITVSGTAVTLPA